MFAYFLIGVALLIALLYVARALASVPPRQLLTAGKWVGLGAIGGATVFLVATGRLSWALTAAAAFLPWIVRLVERSRTRRFADQSRGGGAKSGKASQVETATLRMTLDHATGDLDGEVLKGRYAGRWLSDLALEDLADLLRHCRGDDPAAAPLLETYLDRHHDGWRGAEHGSEQAGEGHGGRRQAADTPTAMTPEDAYRILGLAPGASEAEVRAAHRRLIAGLHPDRGGSSFLAALINRARDVLLRVNRQ